MPSRLPVPVRGPRLSVPVQGPSLRKTLSLGPAQATAPILGRPWSHAAVSLRTTHGIAPRTPCRAYSSLAEDIPDAPRQRASATTVPQVFHRGHKKLQKDRAALSPDARTLDYLKDEVAERLVDRLLDIKRRFSIILDLGSGAGHLVKYLDKDLLDRLVMLDMSKNMLERDAAEHSRKDFAVDKIVGDEETLLKHVSETSFDCVLSSLALHWVNDLPGTLIQARRALRPDGAFIAALFGGDTLYELRTSLQLAELERKGGLGVHVSPFASVKDVGGLLSRAGLSLTTVDVDEISVSYPSMFELLADLRGMGESNAVIQRAGTLDRDVLVAASAIYKELYGNKDGSIPATFQVIYLIGWAPK